MRVRCKKASSSGCCCCCCYVSLSSRTRLSLSLSPCALLSLLFCSFPLVAFRQRPPTHFPPSPLTSSSPVVVVVVMVLSCLLSSLHGQKVSEVGNDSRD
ncbi:hypothetical protein LY78DRAFT_187680 [Colletotrichum sublineola]|nr:hypothetical protein LY78DRAFT_187680 [Colletotrichum sublineola]